jgi:hypothetical protein
LPPQGNGVIIVGKSVFVKDFDATGAKHPKKWGKPRTNSFYRRDIGIIE